MANESNTVENKSEKTTGKKGMPVIAILLVLVVGGGVAWFFFRRTAPNVQASAKTESADKAVLHLEGFVVNLADPEENHFLRLGVDLGLDRPVGKGGRGEKSELPTSRIRDTILSVLTTWRSDSLLAPDGKAKLKEDLVRALQERVPELGVREVYLTDFLVQR